MNLQHHFLIAMPAMDDPLFQRAVVYICEHSQEGAMGLIINKPMENLKVNDVLSKLDIATTLNGDQRKLAQTVYNGGPLSEERGFILQSTLSNAEQNEAALLTSSKQLLELLGQEQINGEILMTLGYCSWDKNQLEDEILANAWLTAPACNDILFSTPISERWLQAGKLVGVDMLRMSLSAGHA
jgi:putative transcriptional regulator